MTVSSQQIDEELRKAAKDKADGVRRMSISPAALKRKLAAKKAAQRAAKAKGDA